MPNERNQPKRENAEELCWGRNPVLSLLETASDRCMKVLLAKTVQGHIRARISELCKASGVPLHIVEAAAIDRLAPGERHQGLAACVTSIKLWKTEELLRSLPPAPEPSMLLLCDHIQDPHNLGAVIRTAEAAGADAVLFPKRGGALPTGAVVKSSAGAALRLPLTLTGNVSQTIKLLQEAGFWVVGLSAEAEETLFKTDMPPRTAFVIGSEGEGLGRVVAQNCDELRRIPMRGGTGSLNASVAAGLAMFEWVRSV